MADIANYPLPVWRPLPATGPLLRTDASVPGLPTPPPLATQQLQQQQQQLRTSVVSHAPNSVKMKRGHVSKACTNCRKMHAGCDIQRPCSRCVFHRMESSCVDIPRKKRITRGGKKGGEDSPDDSPPEVTAVLMEEGNEPADKAWKDTFSELFGEMNNNNNNKDTGTPLPAQSSLPATPANPNSFFQQNMLFTDLLAADTDPSIKNFQPNDFLNADSSLYESPKKDFQELKQQMEDLRQSNVALETKLNTVTTELTEMRQKMQQMLHLLGGFFVPSPQTGTNNSKTTHDFEK